MTRRLNFWLLSVLLIIAIPYYWYLVDPGAGPGAVEPKAKPLTMTRLRALAAETDGPRPVELRVETVGVRNNSRNMLVAGSGLRSVPNTVRAYELVVPGQLPVVIDAGTSAKVAQEDEFDSFDQAAQARIARTISRAGHFVLLVDLPNHNGGHRHPERPAGKDIPPSSGAPYALVPGVVVIPVTGLQRGTVMVYARLANGREYLFTGDVAKLHESWIKVRASARLATRGEPDSYRSETLSWLMTINALHRAAPGMIVVPGHDPAHIPYSTANFSN